MITSIALATEQIAAICRKYRARRLALFGSALHGDFGPESDVDLLVVFEPDAQIGLFGLTAMGLELADLIGRKVDLDTPGFLSDEFRDQILAEAETIYPNEPDGTPAPPNGGLS